MQTGLDSSSDGFLVRRKGVGDTRIFLNDVDWPRHPVRLQNSFVITLCYQGSGAFNSAKSDKNAS